LNYMNRVLPIICLFLTVQLHAETPDEVLTDYLLKASKASEKLDLTLRRQGEAVVKKLIQNGAAKDAAGAAEQVEAKAAGKPVQVPHMELKQLFAQYDAARETALAPIRTASLARLDALLKTSSGQGMQNLVRVAECKAQIQGGSISPASSPELSKTKGQIGDHLRDNKIAKTWGYYLSKDYAKRYGTLTLNKDGTFVINAASPASGSWTPTADPFVLSLDIKNASGVPEVTELAIKGEEATLKRISGIRYLKAD
jgi:hypothetical protein